jgi:hypothetical protein
VIVWRRIAYFSSPGFAMYRCPSATITRQAPARPVRLINYRTAGFAAA